MIRSFQLFTEPQLCARCRGYKNECHLVFPVQLLIGKRELQMNGCTVPCAPLAKWAKHRAGNQELWGASQRAWGPWQKCRHTSEMGHRYSEMLKSCFPFRPKKQKKERVADRHGYNTQAESFIIGRWLNPKGDFSPPWLSANLFIYLLNNPWQKLGSSVIFFSDDGGSGVGQPRSP